MDIEAISGPKLKESIKSRKIKPGVVPVVEAGPISIIDDGSQHENYYTWIIEDRVTISSRARRRYNAMIAERE